METERHDDGCHRGWHSGIEQKFGNAEIDVRGFSKSHCWIDGFSDSLRIGLSASSSSIEQKFWNAEIDVRGFSKSH